MNLDGVTLTGIIGIAGFISTLMSIAAFWLGQKKAASPEGKDKGLMESDMNNLKEAMKTLTKSFDTLTIKLETQDEKREKDYREMLISLTEVKSSYKSLHIRVDDLCKRMEGMNK